MRRKNNTRKKVGKPFIIPCRSQDRATMKGKTIMTTIEQRIEAVRNDREHGSRWLVLQTIGILHDLAREQVASQEELMQRLLAAGRALSQARPAMAALSSAVGRILNTQGGPQAVAHAAEQLLQDYDT